MAGFAQGFTQSRQDYKDKMFQEKRDQKNHERDMAKLNEQYRLQFQNSSKLAQEEFNRERGLLNAEMFDYVRSQGVDPESSEGARIISDIKANGGLKEYTKRKYDREQDAIKAKQPNIKVSTDGTAYDANPQSETFGSAGEVAQTITKQIEDRKRTNRETLKTEDRISEMKTKDNDMYEGLVKQIGGFDFVDQQLSSANTGKYAPLQNSFRSIVTGLGLPVSDELISEMSSTQMISILGKTNAINKLKTYAGPKSNFEFEQFVSLENSPENLPAINKFIYYLGQEFASREAYIIETARELDKSGKMNYEDAKAAVLTGVSDENSEFYRPFTATSKGLQQKDPTTGISYMIDPDTKQPYLYNSYLKKLEGKSYKDEKTGEVRVITIDDLKSEWDRLNY